MWEKQLLCCFPHPVKQQKFIVQNKTTEKTEGLTREESKSRDTQSSEQKRDEISYFAAKGRLERIVLGVQTKRCTCKKLQCHQRGSHKLPNEGRREVNATCERFLCLDAGSPVPLSAGYNRGVVVDSWKQWQAQCINFCMSTSHIFCKNFLATQIRRDYSSRSQCHLL